MKQRHAKRVRKEGSKKGVNKQVQTAPWSQSGQVSAQAGWGREVKKTLLALPAVFAAFASLHGDATTLGQKVKQNAGLLSAIKRLNKLTEKLNMGVLPIGRGSNGTPRILLQGQWLEEAGFSPPAVVKIQVWEHWIRGGERRCAMNAAKHTNALRCVAEAAPHLGLAPHDVCLDPELLQKVEDMDSRERRAMAIKLTLWAGQLYTSVAMLEAVSNWPGQSRDTRKGRGFYPGLFAARIRRWPGVATVRHIYMVRQIGAGRAVQIGRGLAFFGKGHARRFLGRCNAVSTGHKKPMRDFHAKRMRSKNVLEILPGGGFGV
jgi:hypothetical protein